MKKIDESKGILQELRKEYAKKEAADPASFFDTYARDFIPYS